MGGLQNKPTILIAEDDMMSRVLMKKSLANAGFNVIETEDGAQAIDAMRRSPADIVLLDVMMPVCDGFQACTEIRKLPKCDQIPILMVTGLDDIDSIAKAYDAGATDFITKPINWLVLSQRVRYILRASKALEEVRQGEARLAAAQRLARLGDWVYDPSRETFSLSADAARIIGVGDTPQQLTLNAYLNFVQTEDRSIVSDLLHRAVSAFQLLEIDHGLRLPGNIERAVHLQAQAEPDGIISGIIQDITDRKKYEEVLRITQFSIDRAGDGVIWTDFDGNILYLNDAVGAMHGYTDKEELLLKKIYHLRSSYTLQQWHEHWGELKKGHSLVTEVEHTRKDGSTVVVEISENFLPYKGKEFNCAFIRDITVRKQAEADLLAAKEQAEIASRSKSEFLANMSHELRTPLNAIIGFARIIADQMFGAVGNEKYSEYSRDIVDSGTHLLNVINDILDLSKIESGKYELNDSEFDFRKVAESSLRIIGERARDAKLELSSDISVDIPYVFGDERIFKQVLLNLLSNAVKFTPEGGRVSLNAAMTPAGDIEVRVKDSGIGMRPEDISKALAPFVQVDTGLARKHQGTGLGLPLSKTFVELHGGSFAIDTAPGAGTTVIFTIAQDRLLRL
jgi:PAS domain S-box-containing protein